jgi:bacterioferritin-associated ferredoxin
MDPDDELCLCFHVTRRKVENYLRLERPQRAAQLADCYGAGTGCGWCRPFLQRLFEAAAKPPDAPPDADAVLPSPAEYALSRTRYVRAGGGAPPPGATPIDAE